MREGLKSNSWHAKIEMRPKNLLKKNETIRESDQLINFNKIN